MAPDGAIRTSQTSTAPQGLSGSQSFAKVKTYRSRQSDQNKLIMVAAAAAGSNVPAGVGSSGMPAYKLFDQINNMPRFTTGTLDNPQIYQQRSIVQPIPPPNINLKKFKQKIIKNEQPLVMQEDPIGIIQMTGDHIDGVSKRRLQILNALKSLQNQKKLPQDVPGSIQIYEDVKESLESPMKSRNQLGSQQSANLDTTPKKKNFFVYPEGQTDLKKREAQNTSILIKNEEPYQQASPDIVKHQHRHQFSNLTDIPGFAIEGLESQQPMVISQLIERSYTFDRYMVNQASNAQKLPSVFQASATQSNKQGPLMMRNQQLSNTKSTTTRPQHQSGAWVAVYRQSFPAISSTTASNELKQDDEQQRIRYPKQLPNSEFTSIERLQESPTFEETPYVDSSQKTSSKRNSQPVVIKTRQSTQGSQQKLESRSGRATLNLKKQDLSLQVQRLVEHNRQKLLEDSAIDEQLFPPKAIMQLSDEAEHAQLVSKFHYLMRQQQHSHHINKMMQQQQKSAGKVQRFRNELIEQQQSMLFSDQIFTLPQQNKSSKKPNHMNESSQSPLGIIGNNNPDSQKWVSPFASKNTQQQSRLSPNILAGNTAPSGPPPKKSPPLILETEDIVFQPSHPLVTVQPMMIMSIKSNQISTKIQQQPQIKQGALAAPRTRFLAPQKQQQQQAFIRRRSKVNLIPSENITVVAIPQQIPIDDPQQLQLEEKVQEILIDPRQLRVVQRLIFNQETNPLQRLMIYATGVLWIRDHQTGQYIFREGIQEGLIQIASKVRPNLKVTILIGEQEEKSVRRQLLDILLSDLCIKDSIDEIVILNRPLSEQEGIKRVLPNEILENVDQPTDLIWLLPLEVEYSEFKDALRSKTFETVESTTDYLKESLKIFPPEHENLNNQALIVSHLGFDQDRAVSFSTLAKSISSLFLLGQIQSKPQVVPAAALPILRPQIITNQDNSKSVQDQLFSWGKSYQTIVEHQILSLTASSFLPSLPPVQQNLQEKLYLSVKESRIARQQQQQYQKSSLGGNGTLSRQWSMQPIKLLQNQNDQEIIKKYAREYKERMNQREQKYLSENPQASPSKKLLNPRQQDEPFKQQSQNKLLPLLIFDEYLFDRVPTLMVERTKFYPIIVEDGINKDIEKEFKSEYLDLNKEKMLDEEDPQNSQEIQEPECIEYPGTLSQRLEFFIL